MNICLCGSTRFYPQMLRAACRMLEEGDTPLLPSGLRTDNPEMAALLERVHRWKIRQSERVHVLNVGGYIGPSTQAEIVYAEALGIPVSYAEGA